MFPSHLFNVYLLHWWWSKSQRGTQTELIPWKRLSLFLQKPDSLWALHGLTCDPAVQWTSLFCWLRTTGGPVLCCSTLEEINERAESYIPNCRFMPISHNCQQGELFFVLQALVLRAFLLRPHKARNKPTGDRPLKDLLTTKLVVGWNWWSNLIQHAAETSLFLLLLIRVRHGLDISSKSSELKWKKYRHNNMPFLKLQPLFNCHDLGLFSPSLEK